MIEEYMDLVQLMKQTARKFYDLRYQMSNGGNLSVRAPGRDWMIVKGTDVAFDEVDAGTLVAADFNGHVLEGSIKPSKESLLHGAIYKKLPQVNAIMHCHSPWATAWAAGHERLEFATYHSEMKLYGEVPVFDTHSYAVPEKAFPQILELFDRNPNAAAFLLRGHGQVAVGKDMRSAAYLAELVEETAQISILAGGVRV